jgi:hypothetical protein
MDETVNKIKTAFIRYFKSYFIGGREVEIRGVQLNIVKVLNVYPDVDTINVPLHKLLSGKQVTINISGSALINQKVENGSKNRNIEFWANNSEVIFNSENEEFEIVNIPQLLFINFDI